MSDPLTFDFYRGFDLSTLLLRMSQPGSLPFLGAGADFRAYLVKRPVGCSHVLKLAHRDFIDSRQGNFEAWLDAMRRLKGFDVPLLPPYEILNVGEEWGYVVPFGERVRSDRMTGFDGSSLWKRCQESLGKIGLALLDVPQVRWYKDRPFIIDLSDLRPCISR